MNNIVLPQKYTVLQIMELHQHFLYYKRHVSNQFDFMVEECLASAVHKMDHVGLIYHRIRRSYDGSAYYLHKSAQVPLKSRRTEIYILFNITQDSILFYYFSESVWI